MSFSHLLIDRILFGKQVFEVNKQVESRGDWGITFESIRKNAERSMAGWLEFNFPDSTKKSNC